MCQPNLVCVVIKFYDHTREDFDGYVVVHLHTNQKRLRKKNRERRNHLPCPFSWGSGTFCGAKKQKSCMSNIFFLFVGY